MPVSEIQEPITFAEGCKKRGRAIVDQARLLTLLLRHPRVPWYAKAVAACTVGYLFSPVQLIPSFIPLIGQLDDVLVLHCGIKLLQKVTPPTVLTECRLRMCPPKVPHPRRAELPGC